MNGNGRHNEASTVTRQEEETRDSFKIAVSARFLVTTVLASCLLAFCVGRAARIAFHNENLLQQECSAMQQQEKEPLLPAYIIGQSIPQSRYLSKNFDSTKSASSSSWLAASRDTKQDVDAVENENKADVCEGELDEDDEEEPAAEHLMVDIKNVDADFLNSERRLANAMLEVIDKAQLKLLSFHCHGLVPTGVSCVGVLEKNYVSFHTWPQQGVITLDVCVGNSKSLMSVVPIIERVFAVPSSNGNEEPFMLWALKDRGFPEQGRAMDLYTYLVNDLAAEVKEQVASVKTDFQTIDIFDTADRKTDLVNVYEKVLHRHRSDNLVPTTSRPDRIVFLDGWIQSTLFNEAAYHEALVHPGMFAHRQPERVAIIGGGECATLREVLKHNTVKEAIMIEIDENMVNASKQYLPEWSDCSDIEGSASWCVDDPRVKMYYQDALAWFVDRYSSGKESQESAEPQLDVIIMDALDPESEIPFAEALYGNVAVMQSFYNSLGSNGILIMQLGESPNVWDPDETYSKHKNRVAVMELLETVGFKSVHAYEEGNCGFGGAWSFVVAFKAYGTRKRWFRNSAEIDLVMMKRGKRAISGANPFIYFDGPTMQSYQVPPRQIETVFCRRRPMPLECRDARYIYNPELSSVPISSFEVRASGQGKMSGRGVYTKELIPPHTYIAPEQAIHAIRFYPYTYKLIVDLEDESPIEYLFKKLDIPWKGRAARQVKCLEYYVHAYGFTSRKHGAREIEVDSSIITFVNHGCSDEYNVGVETDVDEFTADPDEPIEALTGKSHTGTSIFNPVIDRHLYHVGDMSIEEIDAGEEVLDNYLAFVGSTQEWKEDIYDLRRMCKGKTIKGSVTAYEERGP